MTDPSKTARQGVETDADDREAPINVEFREAAPPPRGGPGWLSSFVLMTLAGLGGGALGYGASERMPGLLGGETSANLPAGLVTAAQLEAERGARRAADEASDAASADALSDLAERVARTEGGVDALEAAADPALGERIAALTARLDRIETLPAGEGSASNDALRRALASAAARIDRLEARLQTSGETTDTELDALRSDLGALSARLDMAGSGQRSQEAAVAEAALALSTIEAAARRGQDFSAAFAVLQRVRPDAAAVAQLAPVAARGAPTLDVLQARFDPLADRIVEALERGPGEASGPAGAAGRLFGDLVTVRRPEAAADFAALDEARTAVERQDLSAAVAALSRIEGSAGALAQAWTSEAQDRLTLERALDTLRLDLMVETPTITGQR
ncbi:MAG: hypothetical protein AAGH87_02590 [Pseudomonadota bacterium]